MVARRILSLLTVVLVSAGARLILKVEYEVSEDEETITETTHETSHEKKLVEKKLKKKESYRDIASSQFQRTEEAMVVSEKERELFEDFKNSNDSTESDPESTSVTSFGAASTTSFSLPSSLISSSSSPDNNFQGGKNTEGNSRVSGTPKSAPVPAGFFSAPSPVTTNKSPTQTPKVEEISFSCFTTIDSGTYNSPVSLNVSCTRSATVKYCVGTAGSCCDPNLDYLSPVIIGDHSGGDFCVKLSAISDKGETTLLTKSYIITNQVPNLQSSQPLIYAQTTELSSYIYLSSLDFGKVNYSSYLINLKSHNPGPLALNLNCDEVIAEASTLSSPTPMTILNDYLVSGLNPLSDQIKIPLSTSNLEYGDNYLVSIMSNKNVTPEVHACSNHKFTLMDFEFFNYLPAQASVASGDIREFSGQFTPYGFFEETIQHPRAPAGISEGILVNQRLESGLFGIFF